MSADETIVEAHRIGSALVTFLQQSEPQASPMQATAAVAVALGAMVASMAACEITKPGRSGVLMTHLFRISEQVAAEALDAA